MQMEKPATLVSCEFQQPNAFAPGATAPGRLLLFFPTVQPEQIPVRAGLGERTKCTNE